MTLPVNKVAYDRESPFLRNGQYIRLTDWEGSTQWLIVTRFENMGVSRVQWAGRDILPETPVIRSLAAGFGTQPFDAEWLQPPRENRLYQIRPFFEFRWREGAQDLPNTLFPGVQLNDIIPGSCVRPEHLPCSIDLRVYHPSGMRRLGTGTSEQIIVNNFQQTIGGLQPSETSSYRADAVIPHYFIPNRDDTSSIWDLWTVFGAFPSFEVVNRSLLDIGGEDFPIDAFLCFTGRRYMIDNVTNEELNAILARKPGFEARGITIGGVTQVTTRS